MPRLSRTALARIEPRKRPRQERSQEMVERILEAARQLAGESGFKGLSTAKVARRAGLSIGSLYQYFPSKEAIVVELARRWLAPFRDMVERRAQAPAPRSWRAFSAALGSFYAEVWRLYRRSAVTLPVLELMGTTVELRAVEDEHDRAIVRGLARWFRRVDERLSAEDAVRLGELMLGAGHACFSLAARAAPRRAARIEHDTVAMTLALLKPYLALR